jgi:DNA-binding NarL/FixJ family response regulator
MRAPFTIREIQVIELLICGYDVRSIGKSLGIKSETVHHYIVTANRKVGTRGAHRLAMWALWHPEYMSRPTVLPEPIYVVRGFKGSIRA